MFSTALITSEKSLLISKDMYEIPIPLLIRKNSFSFNYENLPCTHKTMEPTS